MKKALVIHYSQVGQTTEAIEKFCSGLSGYEVDRLKIEEKDNYPFPWKIKAFFRLFPRCILGLESAIEPLNLESYGKDYDLIVIGYQVWFLAPSLPMQALLKDKGFQELVCDKNVLNLVTCRNMWVSAIARVNESLKNLGAKSILNQVLCDQSPAWANFVTTPRWMLTGNKEAFWFFPKAGISQEGFELSRALGDKISSEGIKKLDILPLSHRQEYATILMEKCGYKVFQFWARLVALIAPKENVFQDSILVLFRLSLVCTILVLLPLAILAQLLTQGLFGKSMDKYIDGLLRVSF